MGCEVCDVDDLHQAVREAARVLEPGGRLCVCITHPLADAGRFEDTHAEAEFQIAGSYLGIRRIDEMIQRDGLSMRFTGWVRPMDEYARAFEAAGLSIDLLREPPPTPQAISRDPAEARWARIPNFLFVRSVKLSP